MKTTQYYIAVTVSAACLVLSVWSMWLGQSTQQLMADAQKRKGEIQGELQRRQAEVNKGNQSNQIGLAILKDMAEAARKNEKIKELLTKNGYALPSPTPAP